MYPLLCHSHGWVGWFGLGSVWLGKRLGLGWVWLGFAGTHR